MDGPLDVGGSSVGATIESVGASTDRTGGHHSPDPKDSQLAAHAVHPAPSHSTAGHHARTSYATCSLPRQTRGLTTLPGGGVEAGVQGGVGMYQVSQFSAAAEVLLQHATHVERVCALSASLSARVLPPSHAPFSAGVRVRPVCSYLTLSCGGV